MVNKDVVASEGGTLILRHRPDKMSETRWRFARWANHTGWPAVAFRPEVLVIVVSAISFFVSLFTGSPAIAMTVVAILLTIRTILWLGNRAVLNTPTIRLHGVYLSEDAAKALTNDAIAGLNKLDRDAVEWGALEEMLNDDWYAGLVNETLGILALTDNSKTPKMVMETLSILYEKFVDNYDNTPELEHDFADDLRNIAERGWC